MQNKGKFIASLNATNCPNYLWAKLTRRLMLKKLFSNMLTLQISFAAVALGSEHYLLHENQVQKVLQSVIYLSGALTQTAYKSEGQAQTVINVFINEASK
jgi:hypothetical protein